MDRHTRGGLKLVLGLGVGVGLMAGAVAALLLPGPGLTDDQVQARARELGMVLATSPPPAVSPTPAPAPTEQPPTEPAPTEPAPKTVVTYAISEGTNFGSIAAMLKLVGVVSDDGALIARGRERNALEQVQAGIYTITLDPAKPVTPDQLIDQLLRGPS